MFELIGTLARLPLGLLWIAALFVTWPIGLFFWMIAHGLMVIATPFRFIGFAFSGDKHGWEKWKEELSSELSLGFTYPFSESQKAMKWVQTGD